MTAEPVLERDEARRLAALHSYDILDTLPEAEFDDIAQMAAQACVTAMAHINFIDAGRQWIKAAYGHERESLERREPVSPCRWRPPHHRLADVAGGGTSSTPMAATSPLSASARPS